MCAVAVGVFREAKAVYDDAINQGVPPASRRSTLATTLVVEGRFTKIAGAEEMAKRGIETMRASRRL